MYMAQNMNQEFDGQFQVLYSVGIGSIAVMISNIYSAGF